MFTQMNKPDPTKRITMVCEHLVTHQASQVLKYIIEIHQMTLKLLIISSKLSNTQNGNKAIQEEIKALEKNGQRSIQIFLKEIEV